MIKVRCRNCGSVGEAVVYYIEGETVYACQTCGSTHVEKI